MQMLAKLPARRWWYLMPIIFITYSLAYLDRANYGFAAAAGIESDLGITKGTSSLIGALFFLGYFFFQVPGAIYAVKRSVRKMIFFSLILWGFCAAATGFVSNIPMLMAIRFTLGVVEAVVMPAMLIYISNWFTKTERSRANTFLVLGNPVTVLWMSIVSGYLIHSWGWREMFIIEGIPAVLWAICWWILVRDKPSEVSWLNEQEKETLQKAMDSEQSNIKPVRNYGEALRSRNVIMLCAVHALWSIGVYGFMMWMPSILKSAAHMDIVAVGWLAAVPYLAAICLMLTVSWLSDKFQNRKLFIWPLLLIAAIAFFGSWMVGDHAFWFSYALLVIAAACMYAPYGPFFALIPELLPRNVSGVSMGLINSFGALGAFLGAWLVGYLNGITGGPGVSYTFMAIALLASVVLMYNVRANNEPSSSSVKAKKVAG
ncbi:TPA: MFS transporter [Klebsiella pneumoniae]|nr:MFS transporter [Klebsiella pneumoniae]HCA9846301.1 MFS transporter [Klebsiella variicola subsp. variicola]EIV7934926.1 MFS transporter [Klebsiella pneumoniae]MCI8098957.1 MFS transporter [Klebsiella pneumoniae]RRF82178.1 MFS transporter [Klebsiella pneumoniae]CAF9481696.1 Putative tartrate transporter [Klebsiella pneumoniae]